MTAIEFVLALAVVAQVAVLIDLIPDRPRTSILSLLLVTFSGS